VTEAETGRKGDLTVGGRICRNEELNNL